MTDTGFLTLTQAAELRGVTRQTMHSLVMRGKIKSTRVGSVILLKESDVIAYSPDKGGRPPKPAGEKSRKKKAPQKKVADDMRENKLT
jgi:excisionase family DNA binding protein